VPELAAEVSAKLSTPTIGIGCGPNTDGQIIVVHDILGLLPGRAPSFAKRYADLFGQAAQAVQQYAGEVRSGAFPSAPKAGGASKAAAASADGAPVESYGGKR
jgi:3-methyl-2-oxobutanoate hydroxymethyltransferase